MDTEDKIFQSGELEVIGRLVDASNASLLCTLPDNVKVIYKPIAGERPLWDFPDGNLASREVAAYYISETGNFKVVPKTVLREGPFGTGAIQKWIETSEEADVITMAQSGDSQMRNMALFDIVINNADRKFGHILITPEHRIFGCDHGVSLHRENKLRTVVWQFAEKLLQPAEVEQLNQLLSQIDRKYLATYLSEDEINAIFERTENLLKVGRFSSPNPNWPAVPWPPY
ncbi:MAG: SCO1664 family protein [Actinobacteria bacterium]|nr:SCO1664 family protein [Actinomycetota bacterium]MDA2981719.1 SCO1664 family protein [Actinomycetota bacterium]MDA2996617.1 SCO1664 family protein [Actinomycetota bacterium]